MAPVEEHISRGLYGMMIIDPPTPRPPAIEMVGMLNSYSFSYQGVNGSGHFPPTVPATMKEIRDNLSDVIANSDEGNGPDNQFYSINGMPFGYTGPNEIKLQTNTPYRMYIVNMVEFDPVNSFHIHGTMMNFTESGTLTSPKVYTDIVTLGQGDRGIAEFNYPLPGVFMIHAHINHFTDLGWIGFLNVAGPAGNPIPQSSQQQQPQQQQPQQPQQPTPPPPPPPRTVQQPSQAPPQPAVHICPNMGGVSASCLS
jgi:FtsP/CotA-like multicopper oxidase with cupredoxin domain